MTKQDFEFIASAIRGLIFLGTREHAIETRHAIAWQFATQLAKTNPRFDTARFLAACGV
jgi:hypothetical protein